MRNPRARKTVIVVENLWILLPGGVRVLHKRLFDFTGSCDGVFLLVNRACQRPANLVNHALIGQCAVCGHSCSLIRPKPAGDILKNPWTVIVDHIYVDITDFLPVFVTEPRKHGMPCLRVQVDNVSHVGRPGAANGTTGRANGHPIFLAPANQVRHGEHEPAHLQLLENSKLLLDGGTESRLLLTRNHAGVELVIERLPGSGLENPLVLLLGTVQNGILDRTVQLEVLTQRCNLIGVLDGGVILVLGQRSLLGKHIQKLVHRLVGEVEGVLVTVGFAL